MRAKVKAILIVNRFYENGSRFYQDLSKDLTVAKGAKGLSGPFQREGLMNNWANRPLRGPLQNGVDIGSVPAVAADNTLLFNE